MNKILIFDSTLRDGAQAEGISFSVADKLKIVETLDELGVSYIEAGNPGSNPKDLEFFKNVRKIELKNAKLTAFGSTRRMNTPVEDDANINSLIRADTPTVAIFGKTWDFHVEHILKTTLEENLNMIYDTIKFFKDNNKEVVFDAEHFFDGYKNNKEYALKTLQVALKAGADCLVLCETNGGSFPNEVYDIVKEVSESIDANIGIHAHDDTGMAVANSIMAVLGGANHVQGTLIGFGERCGNANLSTIIPNLQLKKGYRCIEQDNIEKLTITSRKIAEISNISLKSNMPYVGRSAFTHKAGMHIDGVTKASKSFEHIEPSMVGNERRFLMSEVAGRSTIIEKIQKLYPHLEKNHELTTKIIDEIKKMEHRGYQFEGADGTFELLVRKTLGKYKPFFDVGEFKIIGEQPNSQKGISSSAIIKLVVDGKKEITAAEGEGPVNALDKALRKALEGFYPELKNMHLTDYKVRVLNTQAATAAITRVLIESTDGEDYWSTVGVSSDIIEASWIALVDSIEYKLIKDIEKKFKTYL
ncbi:citramalate synthase [Romboutsia sp.]|uniref:citramalate synthase n=1 Tax=Romboutsia sp. TaxID=1965302 RepID=UPI003F2DF9A7